MLEIDEISRRQNSVKFFIGSGLLRAELVQKLRSLSDLERLTSRVISGHANPRDVTAFRSTLQIIPDIRTLFQIDNIDTIKSIIERIHFCRHEFELLQSAISEDPPATLQNTGVIKPGYSNELGSGDLSFPKCKRLD